MHSQLISKLGPSDDLAASFAGDMFAWRDVATGLKSIAIAWSCYLVLFVIGMMTSLGALMWLQSESPRQLGAGEQPSAADLSRASEWMQSGVLCVGGGVSLIVLALFGLFLMGIIRAARIPLRGAVKGTIVAAAIGYAISLIVVIAGVTLLWRDPGGIATSVAMAGVVGLQTASLLLIMFLYLLAKILARMDAVVAGRGASVKKLARLTLILHLAAVALDAVGFADGGFGLASEGGVEFPWWILLQAIGVGLVMGFGAVAAGRCSNIIHDLAASLARHSVSPPP